MTAPCLGCGMQPVPRDVSTSLCGRCTVEMEAFSMNEPTLHLLAATDDFTVSPDEFGEMLAILSNPPPPTPGLLRALSATRKPD